MKRISENYDAALKEDLFAEIEKRKGEGSPNFESINTSSLKPDLVASLQLDDDHKASKPSETPEAKSGGKAIAIPKVEPKPIPDEVSPELPKDEDYTHGLFVKLTGQDAGEQFAVAVHPEDSYGRTHTAKNSLHFWQGNAAQFREHFDKAK